MPDWKLKNRKILSIFYHLLIGFFIKSLPSPTNMQNIRIVKALMKGGFFPIIAEY